MYYYAGSTKKTFFSRKELLVGREQSDRYCDNNHVPRRFVDHLHHIISKTDDIKKNQDNSIHCIDFALIK